MTHIPGGWAVQHYGGKAVLTLNMVGSCLLCIAIPLAMRVRQGSRALSLAAVLFGLGLFQGPLIPALQHMRKDWLPTGPGRAVAMRLQSLGGYFNGIVAPVLPPLLALRNS